MTVYSGLTQTQHDQLMDTTEDYLHVDPMTLLTEDQNLLSVDFDAPLKRLPPLTIASDQETWTAEMETNFRVATHNRIRVESSNFGIGRG